MNFLILLIFLWEQKVKYKINVELDTTSKILKGYEEVLYINNSPDSLNEIYFHLYLNAYKSLNTYAFNKFFENYLISFIKIFGNFFYKGAYIQIDSVKIKNKKIEYEVQGTILRIPLINTLKNKDSVKLKIFFKTKLPGKVRYRSGYENNHYDIGQFYPVACVYDKKGWHNHQWYFWSEFYHNFSDYSVKIKVPGNFIVAGVGECVSGNDTLKTEGKKEVIFKAENVVDYFFSCDPDFTVQDTFIDNVHIMAFYREKNKTYKDSFLIRGIRAFKWLKELFGEYPYKWVKLVDGLIGGGMEYPGLALCGKDEFSLILHELGHTYFMGILASNQEDEAWLDEGGTTFQTRLYEIKNKGKENLIYENTKNIISQIRTSFDDILLTSSYSFKNNYFSVYSKGSHIYEMLRNIMGDEKFYLFLKEYYKRFKFKHPTTDSLFKLAEEIYGNSLSFIKDIYVKNLPKADFGIEKIKKIKENDKWKTEIEVINNGNTVYPLDLLIINEKDTFKTKLKTFKKDTLLQLETDFEPQKFILDPLNHSLDIKRLDNFYPKKFIRKFTFFHFSQDDALTLNYSPVIFYSPDSWISPGFKFTFSYLDLFPYLKGEFYYSHKKKDFYYDISFKYYFPFVGYKNGIEINTFGFEKKYYFRILFNKKFQEYINDPKRGYLSLGFSYKNVKEGRNFLFQDSNIAGFIINLIISPSIDIFTNYLLFNFSIYPKKLSGDFSFRKFYLIYKISFAPFYRFGIKGNFSDLLNLKIFYGRIEGNFPLQEYFNNYSVSSWGILSSFIERNFVLSGDFTFIKENGVYLKGYKFLKFKDVLSFYISSGIKGLGFFYEKILWGDYGVWDAGIYLKKNFWSYKMRAGVYFPLYVNAPELNGEKNEFGLRIKILIDFWR